MSTWVWFWRRNPSTTLWNCWVHRSQRRSSPGRANSLAVKKQRSQKRHLYHFRENFPPHCLPHQELKGLGHKCFFFSFCSMWPNAWSSGLYIGNFFEKSSFIFVFIFLIIWGHAFIYVKWLGFLFEGNTND